MKHGGGCAAGVLLCAIGACVSTSPAQTAVGFISDGHVHDGPASPPGAGIARITGDLDALDDDLPPGWELSCVVTAGDITDISTPVDDNFDAAYAASDLHALPIFFGVGNHETTDNALDMPALRAKFAGYPDWNLLPGPAHSPETTYSFDTGEIHVAVLNVYADGTCDTCAGGDVGDELFAWLKGDLRGSAQPCKIVCAHEPAYPEFGHVGDSLDQYPDHRNRFWSLLQTEGVAAFITGHTHHRKMVEHGGVYEIAGGPFGWGYWNRASPTFTYVRGGGDEGFEILQKSRVDEDTGWGVNVQFLATQDDLEWRVLANTGEGAGTPLRYFTDYTAADQSPNPDWSANNGGRWWEPAFDDAAAGWSDGESGVGYDAEEAWPWMNSVLDPRGGVYATFQRIRFTAPPRGDYQLLFLEADYDDALVVWLNGTEIFRSDNAPSVGEGDFWDKLATYPRDAGGDHARGPGLALIDATPYMDLLLEGGNLLAAGNWNCATDSHDLASGVRFSIRYHPSPIPVLVNFQPSDSGSASGFTPAAEEAFGASYPFGWR